MRLPWYEDALNGNLAGVERHLIGDGFTTDDQLGDHLFGDMVRASGESIVYGSLGAYTVFQQAVRDYLRQKQEQLNRLPND